MPGLGGLQVQRSISAQTSVPVIFIAGRGDIPSTVTAMKGGAIDFLTKPVDDRRVLESLLNFFASCGYDAETHLSAEQFLGSSALSRCMNIIADIEMRKMSGLGVLQYIRSKNSGLPVVIITGKRYEDSEAFYLERGAVAFFRKPVDCDALLQLIESVCG